MSTGARKKREMDWKLVASFFTVTSMDIFCGVVAGYFTIKSKKNIFLLSLFSSYLFFMYLFLQYRVTD